MAWLSEAQSCLKQLEAPDLLLEGREATTSTSQKDLKGIQKAERFWARTLQDCMRHMDVTHLPVERDDLHRFQENFVKSQEISTGSSMHCQPLDALATSRFP